MKKNLLAASTFFVGAFLYGQTILQNVPEQLIKNADVLYLNRNVDLRIKKVDRIVRTTDVEVVIMNKSGEYASVIEIPYDDNAKISSIQVEVYDQNNKLVTTYSKSDFTDYNNSSSNDVFTDNRVFTLKPRPLVYPYKVKYSYISDTSDTAFIQDLYPYYNYNVGSVQSKMTLTNESGINLRSKVTDTELGKVTEDKNGQTWVYTYNSMAPVEREPYSPSLVSLLPKVQFSLDRFSLAGKQGTITDWDSFGKWYYTNLIEPSSVVTPEIKAEVESLKLTGSIDDKVKRLFQHMQDKTRYVSVQMGIGGWQPMPIQKVSEKRYGDCKALSNYMRGLLLAAGIKSYYSVIYSDESPISFDTDFPRMGGNHAILVVPTEKGNIWLENTSQTIGFNHLSYTTTNRNVLAVSEEGIKIINTPNYSAKQSVEKIVGKMKLQKDGSATFSSTFNYTGYQYDLLRSTVGMREQDRKEAMKNVYASLPIDDLKVNQFVNDRSNSSLNYEIDFKLKNYTSELNDDLIISAVPLAQRSLRKEENRKLPLELHSEYSEDYTIEYEAPQGYKFSDLPQATTFKSEFGNYTLSFEKVGDNIKVIRKLEFKKGRYPSTEYNNYANFVRKINNKDNTQLILTKL